MFADSTSNSVRCPGSFNQNFSQNNYARTTAVQSPSISNSGIIINYSEARDMLFDENLSNLILCLILYENCCNEFLRMVMFKIKLDILFDIFNY